MFKLEREPFRNIPLANLLGFHPCANHGAEARLDELDDLRLCAPSLARAALDKVCCEPVVALEEEEERHLREVDALKDDTVLQR